MIKMAKLKQIFRTIDGNRTPIDVLSDRLDDNAVDTINIKNSAITNSKVLNDTLTFEKVNESDRFVTTNEGICCLRDVGGLSIGTTIHHVDLHDLLKEILIPYTKAQIGTPTASINSSNVSLTTMYYETGSSISIGSIKLPVMIKSDPITKISFKRTPIQNYPYISSMDSSLTNESIISESSTGITGFIPNNDKDFLSSASFTLTPTGISNSLKIRFYVYDTNKPNEPATKDILFNWIPPVFYVNSNIEKSGSYSSDSAFINALYNNENRKTINPSSSSYKYGSTGSIDITYPNTNNEYSYILLPSTEYVIKKAIDQNNFEQDIDEVEATSSYSITLNGISIPYRIFRNHTKNTTTNPRYKFNVIKEV